MLILTDSPKQWHNDDVIMNSIVIHNSQHHSPTSVNFANAREIRPIDLLW